MGRWKCSFSGRGGRVRKSKNSEKREQSGKCSLCAENDSTSTVLAVRRERLGVNSARCAQRTTQRQQCSLCTENDSKTAVLAVVTERLKDNSARCAQRTTPRQHARRPATARAGSDSPSGQAGGGGDDEGERGLVAYIQAKVAALAADNQQLSLENLRLHDEVCGWWW